MDKLRRALIGAALAAVASAGIAVGAELSAGDPAVLAPSDAPALLGPVTESGRAGWECVPERTARAAGLSDADLPQR